jgi:hypothetical protein
LLRREGPETGLRGAPAQPRLKTYAAQSGYIYHYRFLGYRDLADAVEYVFEVSTDRKQWFAACVALDRSRLRDAVPAGQPPLAGQEIYAVAKLTLFAAFDDRPHPDGMKEPVVLRDNQAAEIVAELGIR